jgi:hypothetical protein
MTDGIVSSDATPTYASDVSIDASPSVDASVSGTDAAFLRDAIADASDASFDSGDAWCRRREIEIAEPKLQRRLSERDAAGSCSIPPSGRSPRKSAPRVFKEAFAGARGYRTALGLQLCGRQFYELNRNKDHGELHRELLQEVQPMSVNPSSIPPSFFSRVVANEAARRGFAGAVAGLLIAGVLELWNPR